MKKKMPVLFMIVIVFMAFGIGLVLYVTNLPEKEQETVGQNTTQSSLETTEMEEGIVVLESDPIKLVTRNYYTDPYKLKQGLEVLNFEITNGNYSNDEITDSINRILDELESGNGFYNKSKYIMATENGVVSGADSDECIGGGIGYSDIIKEGTYIVSTAEELVKAAEKATAGEIIFIKGNAKIDLTEYNYSEQYILKLNDGVTLASDRGQGNSKGGVIYTTALRSSPMIKTGENVRITGLCIKGPVHADRYWGNFSMGTGILVEKSGLLFDNCEISGFNKAAIEITNGENQKIYNNYIHHNRSEEAGYGISIKSKEAFIKNNLFNDNSTSVYGKNSYANLNCMKERMIIMTNPI